MVGAGGDAQAGAREQARCHRPGWVQALLLAGCVTAGKSLCLSGARVYSICMCPEPPLRLVQDSVG